MAWAITLSRPCKANPACVQPLTFWSSHGNRSCYPGRFVHSFAIARAPLDAGSPCSPRPHYRNALRGGAAGLLYEQWPNRNDPNASSFPTAARGSQSRCAADGHGKPDRHFGPNGGRLRRTRPACRARSRRRKSFFAPPHALSRLRTRSLWPPGAFEVVLQSRSNVRARHNGVP